jgi:hypothetical protein
VGRFEDFEKGVGTYLKVIRFPQPMNPDAFVILYLRPKSQFLFVGYWSGYERSVAAGSWERQASEVRLKGKGQLTADSLPGPDGGRFERVFTVENANHTPSLTASGDIEGWSLLSWTGPFVYVGQHTVIDPDGRWMPNSLSRVDAWIAEILGA